MTLRFLSRLIVILAASFLCACHTTRHVVTDVNETHDVQSGHQEQAVLTHLDSLITSLSVTADSITILLYDNAMAVTTPCSSTSASAPDSLQGAAPQHPPGKTSSVRSRITIHSPALNKEERRGSNTFQQTNMADSIRSHADTSTHTDSSKESIGVAEPPKLTWVFIVLGIGIPLLIILAIFGYLWLHKRGII